VGGVDALTAMKSKSQIKISRLMVK
jgi:hypothetical protein